jgi:hypothetical protein
MARRIEDLRFTSSSIDEFFHERRFRPTVAASPAPAASPLRIRVASLQQLAGYSLVAEDRLVRLSQQDFWKLGQDDEGLFIERLVDDDSGPVKG